MELADHAKDSLKDSTYAFVDPKFLTRNSHRRTCRPKAESSGLYGSRFLTALTVGRNRATRSFRQLRRFHHVINSDEVLRATIAIGFMAPSSHADCEPW